MSTASPGRFRIGDLDFDAETGEIRRRRGASSESVGRLAPQPTRLLALLASRGGELVTRDEIRRSIWEDVEVEFESSLHFCIRQIRSAIGDSATTSHYIETLPRRGYRLLVPVEPLGSIDRGPASPRRRVVGVLVAVAAMSVAAFLVTRGRSAPPVDPIRIAVMTFEQTEANDVAETIVEQLTNATKGRALVIGPTTTSAYDGNEAMRRLADEYDLDYVVNGRFLDEGVLAELIRVSDGAHVWVTPYENLNQAEVIGGDISKAVLGILDPVADER